MCKWNTQTVMLHLNRYTLGNEARKRVIFTKAVQTE